MFHFSSCVGQNRRFGVLLVGLLLARAVLAANLDLPPPSAFTIVVIPDTQGYRGARNKVTPRSTDALTNPVFANHIGWIRENVGRQRVVFVSHVGDIVDIDNQEQWALAKRNIDRLMGVVPFGLVVGNHDMAEDGDASSFQRAFPEASFKASPWYGGSFTPDRRELTKYGDNVNSYQLFSAGGMQFIFLHLECNAPDPVLNWANSISDRYKDRRALISTHMDLGVREKPGTREGFIFDPKGRMRWTKIHGGPGNSAVQMWDKLYSKHRNLGFVFSGDQSRVTAYRLTEQAANGNVVHGLLSDYMSVGPLRLYRFIPNRNRVQVITYDTSKHAVVDHMPYVPDHGAHQFCLIYDMHSGIGTAASWE